MYDCILAYVIYFRQESVFITVHGVPVRGTHHFDGQLEISVLSSLACNISIMNFGCVQLRTVKIIKKNKGFIITSELFGIERGLNLLSIVH